MNGLFVAYKPRQISSNDFLYKIKKRYKIKRIGYSGTLDPFASGCLIMASGQYTKLFNYLKKSPKKYIATLFLGAYSETLDIEKINQVDVINKISITKIENTLKELIGELKYLPPKYSAKKINGQRAYDLARREIEFELKTIKSRIFDIKLISYMHPFLTFEISVSEGSYIRSIGQIIAKKFGFEGSLSMLERISEGNFIYQNEKKLNPLCYLDMRENFYTKDSLDILKGVKLSFENFAIKEDGVYYLKFAKSFSIIELKDKKVNYLLNNLLLETFE